MKNIGFIQTIKQRILEANSHICVGLDSDYEKLPSVVTKNKSTEQAIFEFNTKIIDATHDIVTAYKSNMVFYAGYGIEGLKALQRTNEYIKKNYPGIKTIADAKRSEMLRSSELTAYEMFNEFHFDAFTATPWFGFDTIEPYQAYEGKAVFIPCHDSNPSAGDIQDVKLENGDYLYEHTTKLVAEKWNQSGNIFIEAPLTYPKILSRINELAGDDEFFMIAGLGAQGGSVSDLSLFKQRRNFIVSASRSIIFAALDSTFDQAARNKVLEYRAQINDVLGVKLPEGA